MFHLLLQIRSTPLPNKHINRSVTTVHLRRGRFDMTSDRPFRHKRVCSSAVMIFQINTMRPQTGIKYKAHPLHTSVLWNYQVFFFKLNSASFCSFSHCVYELFHMYIYAKFIVFGSFFCGRRSFLPAAVRFHNKNCSKNSVQ